MRIAIACQRFDSAAGGLEHWTCQLVRGLAERGHEVHVVAFHAGPASQPGKARQSERPLLHLLPWSGSRLRRARAVQVALAGLKADVVHDLGACWSAGILHPQAGSGVANRRLDNSSRTPRERWEQRLRPSYWRWLLEYREFERRQYARSRGAIIAVSRMVERDLRELHGVAADRIRRIPNGVDTARFSPSVCAEYRQEMRTRLKLEPRHTLYLFAAHNPRLKGFRPLLEAFAQLRSGHPEARLAMIGKTADPEQRRAAARLGVADFVLFEGFVDNVLPYYAAADAFVLPTYYDACSLTVLEALACGLPAITTTHNGAAELMTRKEGFVLDDPQDSHALAVAMARCAEPAARLTMAKAAREMALQNGMDKNIDAIENLYRECAARRTGRTEA